MVVPETQYLRTDDGVYLAYQVVGDGPVDIVVGLHSDESNIDLIWEEPDWRPFLDGLTDFGRLILHDRRGLGVSSRNVPVPNLETQVSDLLAVLDTVGSSRPLLAGASISSAVHLLFAATHPNRVSAIAWNTPSARLAWAPDYPWGGGPAEYERDLERARRWGTTSYGRSIADWRAAEVAGLPWGDLTEVDDDVRVNVYARMNRNTATPDVAEQICRNDWATDLRPVLPSVQAPVAMVTGTLDPVAETEYVASLVPNATVHVVEGRAGAAARPFVEIVRSLAGVLPVARGLDTVLSTVLFTDIVDSTQRQAALGDHGWKSLVEAHHRIVREALTRWRGVENDTAGDGFYATFDGPARAVRCALEVIDRVKELGLDVRAGVHTGECELIDGKCGGLTVTIGARVTSLASATEVLVTQTVKDLVAGSGFTFGDAGEHELKGVPGTWHLFAATD